MTNKLIAETGIHKGLVISFEGKGPWIIGRDEKECNIVLEDPSVSRIHLKCSKTDDGIVLENISETNPVLVNGEKVEEPLTLEHGDEIQIGDGLFRFSEKDQDKPLEKGKGNKEESMEDKQDTIFEEVEEADIPKLADINFDLMETGRWLLKVISGPNNGAEFSMQTGTSYILGTDPATCDIVFHDISVSRQHAKITITEENTLFIEDLNSRNATFIDAKKVEKKQTFSPKTVISMGTTAFIILDRESERDTVISPLLPSISKLLEAEERKKIEEEEAIRKGKQQAEEEVLAKIAAEHVKKAETNRTLATFIIAGILTGVFAVIGIATLTLFQSDEIVEKQVDVIKAIDEALASFPDVQYSFTRSTGRLLLVGHVSTAIDKNELLYNLQSLPFIKSIDDSGIIIDEYVWREANLVIAKNPKWKGVSIYAPSPGKFVLTGYLKTRDQANALNDYLSQNFPFLDRLERKVVVEEDVETEINVLLQENGLQSVTVAMNNGEVTLAGTQSHEKGPILEELIKTIRKIPGVRSVKNFVVELAPEKTIIDLSDQYEVKGSSYGEKGYNVLINNKILYKGDMLDGMTITSIRPHTIFLEKGGQRYRIDYNQ